MAHTSRQREKARVPVLAEQFDESRLGGEYQIRQPGTVWPQNHFCVGEPPNLLFKGVFTRDEPLEAVLF